jgi:hypothetical protein
MGSIDPRFEAAWREWLGALATDADAALAASHVYRELDGDARDALLGALSEDSPTLRVPKVAIYAPLLAVESDPARRARIAHALGSVAPADHRDLRALHGIAHDGSRVLALVRPLYLSFVDVLLCRYAADDGFRWCRHEALVDEKGAPAAGVAIDGVTLEPTPLAPVVEELAHAVLAQRRQGRDLPPPLKLFTHLFDARVEDESPP